METQMLIRHSDADAHQHLSSFVCSQIATSQDQQWFLRAVQTKFLDCVDPVVSGFLDYLYSANVITQRENSSFNGRECNTRRMKARKLFIILCKVSPREFRDKVIPELCSKFPHVVRHANFDELKKGRAAKGTSGGSGSCLPSLCLRHEIVDSRMSPTELADILFHRNLMELSDYRTVSEEYTSKTAMAWDTVLTVVEREATKKPDIVTDILRSLLVTYCLPVPGDLRACVARGLPCLCSQESRCLPPSPSSPKDEIENWLSRSEDEVHRPGINFNSWSTRREPLSESGSTVKFGLSHPEIKPRHNSGSKDVREIFPPSSDFQLQEYDANKHRHKQGRAWSDPKQSRQRSEGSEMEPGLDKSLIRDLDAGLSREKSEKETSAENGPKREGSNRTEKQRLSDTGGSTTCGSPTVDFRPLLGEATAICLPNAGDLSSPPAAKRQCLCPAKKHFRVLSFLLLLYCALLLTLCLFGGRVM